MRSGRFALLFLAVALLFQSASSLATIDSGSPRVSKNVTEGSEVGKRSLHESKAAAPMQRASKTAAEGGPKVEKGIEEIPDKFVDMIKRMLDEIHHQYKNNKTIGRIIVGLLMILLIIWALRFAQEILDDIL